MKAAQFMNVMSSKVKRIIKPHKAKLHREILLPLTVQDLDFLLKMKVVFTPSLIFPSVFLVSGTIKKILPPALIPVKF